MAAIGNPYTMAEGVGGKELAHRDGSDTRTVLRCVDWLLAHKEPIEAHWWEELQRQALHAKSPRDRRHAIEALASRVDPVPKPLLQAVIQGDVTLVWASPSSSPMPPALSSGSSTTSGPPAALEPASSSAIDSLAKL